MDSLDLTTLIPLAVVLARLVVPLFIPAYPLPAILAAMVLDGATEIGRVRRAVAAG